MALKQKTVDALNNFSRSASKAVIDEAEKAGGKSQGFRYTYIGPVDEKTRDICVEMAAAGPLYMYQIEQRGWVDSLDTGGGFNCRHNWEIFVGGGFSPEGQYNEQQEAYDEIKRRENEIMKKKWAKSGKETFIDYDDAKENMENFWGDYDDDDAKRAVEYYTANEYNIINTYARLEKNEIALNNNMLFRNPRKKERYRKFVEDLRRALKESPNFEGRSFRAVALEGDEQDMIRQFAERFQEGNVVNTNQFWSTSAERTGTDAFLNSKAEENYVFVIEGKTGTAVDALSSYTGENEILFNTDTKFIVKRISIENRTQANPEDKFSRLNVENIKVVYLEEIE